MKIINLTQHKASEEQEAEGVFNLPLVSRDILKDLLTVSKDTDIKENVEKIISLVNRLDYDTPYIMIGGAGFLMHTLIKRLEEEEYLPLYAFSEREVVEEDGIKTSVFKHKGWFTPIGDFLPSCFLEMEE